MTTTMATHTSISRPTPIPIAATQSRSERPQTSTRDPLIKLKATPVMASPSTATQGSGEPSNTRSRRDRPCDACRRRKSRCVIHEGAEVCVLCEFHKQECTFVQSPQPRKRRLNSDGREEDTSKRRYAKKTECFRFCSVHDGIFPNVVMVVDLRTESTPGGLHRTLALPHQTLEPTTLLSTITQT
jgi:hypothetical protein